MSAGEDALMTDRNVRPDKGAERIPWNAQSASDGMVLKGCRVKDEE